MTRRLKKLSHSVYECKYHIVFCPKYRYKILEQEVRSYVIRKLHQLCDQREDIEIMELNVQPDHVHVVISIAPKYKVSDIVGWLKGKTALGAFDTFPELRKRYWGQHFWSRGYCVSTVGLDEEAIKKYVRWQNKRNQDSDANQGKLFD